MNIKSFYQKTFNPPEDEINFDSFFKLPLLSFRLIQFDVQGLSENANSRKKIKYFARKCFNWLCLVFCFFLILQFIVFIVVNSDISEVVVRTISDTSTALLITLKGMTIILRKDDIRKILEEFKTLDENRKSGIESFKKRKYLDEYHRVVKFCFGNFIFTNLIYVVLWFPYLFAGKIFHVVKLWFPFDEYRLDLFPFAQIWMQWNVYIVVSFFLTSDLLLYSLITVISMEFDFLKNNMNLFLKSDCKDERSVKIKSFIESHNKLFELSEKLQKIFEPIFLFNFVISSVIMCIVSFHLLFGSTDPANYIFEIIYFITIGGQIWLLCYFGQKLIDSSTAIADGIYDQDWMDLDDNEFKKNVVLIILRAQRPIRLTAMGFADISLETFAAVR